LWRVEPPGHRAGKAARDLASNPARLPRGSRQIQLQFMLVNGTLSSQLKSLRVMQIVAEKAQLLVVNIAVGAKNEEIRFL
jgi:hypothetical protein